MGQRQAAMGQRQAAVASSREAPPSGKAEARSQLYFSLHSGNLCPLCEGPFLRFFALLRPLQFGKLATQIESIGSILWPLFCSSSLASSLSLSLSLTWPPSTLEHSCRLLKRQNRFARQITTNSLCYFLVCISLSLSLSLCSRVFLLLLVCG